MDEIDPLENLWDGLLSREPERICATYETLDLASRAVVLAHLKRMVSESGWHPEQVLSARAALQALNSDVP